MLVPEQKQKVSPVFFPIAQRGLGAETRLDSTRTTRWLNSLHVPERHRGAWRSTALRQDQPLEPSQPPRHCLSTPVFRWLNPGRRRRVLRTTGMWVRGEVWHHVCLSSPCTPRQWKLCCFEQRAADCYKQKLSLCRLMWGKVWHASTCWNCGWCKASWPLSHCSEPLSPCPKLWEDLKTPGEQRKGNFNKISWPEEGIARQKACYFPNALNVFSALKLTQKHVYLYLAIVCMYTHTFNLSL